MNSNLWQLNFNDFWKGLILAVLTAVLTAIYEGIQKGSYQNINWKVVLTVAITSAVAYLLKNLATGSGGQVLTNKPPEQK